nr:4-coumarate--CoA ligase-like 1 [Vanessa tameamea]
MERLEVSPDGFEKIFSINESMKRLWTMDKVVQSPYKDVVIPHMPISEYMWHNLDRWSNKMAGSINGNQRGGFLQNRNQICGITDRRYIYQQLYSQSRPFGANLRKKNKIQDGDAVAIEEEEDPKVVVAVRDTEPIIKEALNKCKLYIPVVVINIDECRPADTVSFKEFIADNNTNLNILKEVKYSVDDVSLFLYSSGTTAPPLNFKDYSSVGFAISNCELRVIDSQLKNLGPNELGELLIKGPNITRGYKNNPEANEKAFVEKEWLRTGDLVKIKEDGSVVIADRLKEIIKINAYQVPPAELENVIKEHPAVFDVVVIEIPDEKTGEKPKAFVVLNKGFNVSEKEIMEHVSGKVAPFKKLKEVVFIDAIPKNSTGKVMRRLLH